MNDFNFHGLPPRLNQAFDANKSSGASLWNNPITRRSFLKRSGAATVGTLVLLSPALNTVAEAEILTLQLSDGTSFTRDFSVTVEWLFDVTAEPDGDEPDGDGMDSNNVTEMELYDQGGDYLVNSVWKNKKVYEGNFKGSHKLKSEGYWGSDACNGIYENLACFVLHTAGKPKVGRYSSITHNGKVSACVMEEDGITPGDDSDVVAEATASVEGATWTIDSKTGVITIPEAKHCIDTSVATVGTGEAKFFVSLGLAAGIVELGCNYLDGSVNWGITATATKGKGVEGEGGGSTGGLLEVKQFKTPQLELSFLWKIRKVKITRYTYVGHDGQTHSVNSKEEFFDINEAERGSKPEDPYVKPPWKD